MREFKIWINEVKQSNMNTGIPMDMVNSLNEIIQEGEPSVVVKVMRQQVRELSQVIQNVRFVTDNLRGLVVDLQEKFNAATPQGMRSSTLSLGDPSPQTSDRQASGLSLPKTIHALGSGRSQRKGSKHLRSKSFSS